MIKVSVIIPVYNVERYIHSCVDSVINQSYDDLEIILVDDGSSDGCPQICDEYARADSRVQVIHKENGGSSDARNVGILAATGDYGLFVDSDDYWPDPNMIHELVDRIHISHADILSYAYCLVDEKTGKVTDKIRLSESMPAEMTDRIEQLDYLTSKGLYVASAWNKLVKMALLKDSLFEKGSFSEDIEWSAKLLCSAERFDYVNKCYYCYRQRKDSIAHTISEKSCQDLKNAIIKCIRIMDTASQQIAPYLGRYVAYQYSTFIAVQAFVPGVQQEFIDDLAPYKYVLRYDDASRKVRLMHYGTSFFGFKNWCSLIRFTKGFWNTRRNIV